VQSDAAVTSEEAKVEQEVTEMRYDTVASETMETQLKTCPGSRFAHDYVILSCVNMSFSAGEWAIV